METSLTENSLAQVKRIMGEIGRLKDDEKLHLYGLLRAEILRKEEIMRRVLKYRGIANGVWDMDAQEYINQLRSDDRL